MFYFLHVTKHFVQLGAPRYFVDPADSSLTSDCICGIDLYIVSQGFTNSTKQQQAMSASLSFFVKCLVFIPFIHCFVQRSTK